MATMAAAIREAVEHHNSKATTKQIRGYIELRYPDQWQPGTLTAHLYGCAVNNPKAYIHHPHMPKFLIHAEDGTYEIYDPKVHGEIKAATLADEEPTAEEAYEVSISLERDLEEHLAKNLSALEPGLTLSERQRKTDVGFIDLFAKDKDGNPVVVEIKAGEAKDSAIGQVTRYLGWVTKHGKSVKPVRGILVADGFSDGAKYSASVVSDLTLVQYRVRFEFEKVSL